MNKINKSLAIGVLLLAVMVPMTTWLAVRNQETRSNAASDSSEVTMEMTSGEVTVDGECGDVDGQIVSAIPDNRYACAKGAVNWMDSKATDGVYNWDCIGTTDGVVAHCEASLQM